MSRPHKAGGKVTDIPCPCGGGAYETCCARYVETGAATPTAVALMRSRYTAYVLRNEAYLRTTWWPDTLPDEPITGADDVKWIALDIVGKQPQAKAPTDEEHATVEFVARFKVSGRAHKLHEISQFQRQIDAAGVPRWYYVDGTFPDD
jgi:SEC-C motif-containing protein